MTELAKPSTAVLALAEAETAARVAWCRERIAEHGYTPSPAPHVWAGRDDIINRIAEEFNIEKLDAAQSVDAAANEYWNPATPEDKGVAKRLSRERLMLVRKRILDALQNGRSDIQYKWEVNDAGERERVPFKEKHYNETSAAMVALLIQVENSIMKLDGLDGVDLGGGVASVIEELDKVIEEVDEQTPGVRRKVTISLAQRIKSEKIRDLTTADGFRRVIAALEEQEKKAKPVKSKVVDGA